MSAGRSGAAIVAAARASHAVHDILLTAQARRRDLVAIAASAGGLTALLQILAQLPPDFTTPIAIVLHRGSATPGVLAGLVARRTKLAVVEVVGGERLEPATIYLAPSDGHLSIAPDRTLLVEDTRRIEHVRSSGNPLFLSAAELFGRGVVAVVLSGTGRNGARGVAAVKEHGGTVLVQSKSTSRFFEMPSAALQTGAVDFVLAVHDIARALVILCAPIGDGVEEPAAVG